MKCYVMEVVALIGTYVCDMKFRLVGNIGLIVSTENRLYFVAEALALRQRLWYFDGSDGISVARVLCAFDADCEVGLFEKRTWPCRNLHDVIGCQRQR